jgi:hypothetical protein
MDDFDKLTALTRKKYTDRGMTPPARQNGESADAYKTRVTNSLRQQLVNSKTPPPAKTTPDPPAGRPRGGTNVELDAAKQKWKQAGLEVPPAKENESDYFYKQRLHTTLTNHRRGYSGDNYDHAPRIYEGKPRKSRGALGALITLGGVASDFTKALFASKDNGK